MLKTKAAHCSRTGSTEGESKYKLTKCLEVLDETKWPTDLHICFGHDSIGTPGKFFNMTPGIVQRCIRAFPFILSLEPTIALKSQIDLKTLLD
jgi:hypothetical protein